jgi:hypothetical protein
LTRSPRSTSWQLVVVASTDTHDIARYAPNALA